MFYTALAALTLSVTGMLTSLTMLMALFLGWDTPLVERGYLLLAALGAVTAVTGALCLPGLRMSGASTLVSVWRRVPAWLLVSQATIFILAGLAWLAVWLAEHTSGVPARAGHGIPVLVLLASAAAFIVAFAQAMRQMSPEHVGGPRRHAGPRPSDGE